jgi:RHS repeat-associated protein
VLATVSDKKLAISGNGFSSTISHFEADVVSASDYSPFGMQLVGRNFSSDKYRYGFNGQEKSTEIDPHGNNMTAEFWQYDARLGRRWNVDPRPNVALSPYSVFGNNPLVYMDPHGDTTVTGAGGKVEIEIDENQNVLDFYDNSIYAINGDIKVPVNAGQLRSFTNFLGTFRAKWSKDETGSIVFSGYLNGKNQTVEQAFKDYKRITSSWLFKIYMWGEGIRDDYEKNPLMFNMKLITNHLIVSGTAAIEGSASFSRGYNPSVTNTNSMSGIGFVTSKVIKKSIVIGEGMYRVKPAARSIGAKWYQAWSKNFPSGRLMTETELDAAKARNARWLNSKMKEGYTIYDIGPKGENIVSPFYQLEINILRESKYPTIRLTGF